MPGNQFFVVFAEKWPLLGTATAAQAAVAVSCVMGNEKGIHMNLLSANRYTHTYIV
jgi:hypothetical protein